MSQQRLKTTTRGSARDDGKPFSILKYWPVIIPTIIFVYSAITYLQARIEVPHYHQDCSTALLSPTSAVSGQPCVYKTANVHLRDTYNGRGIRDGQDIELSFPDSSETSMVIATVDNRMNYNHSTEVQINGAFQVEIWHGKVTAIVNADHRINSINNPEQGGSNFIGFMLLALLFSIILVWACTQFLPTQAAKN